MTAVMPCLLICLASPALVRPRLTQPNTLPSRNHCYLFAVLLIDRKRGKPRHIVNMDAVKALLDAYNVPYTHLVDFRGTFDEQVR